MSDLLVARSSGRVMVRDGDGKPRYYSVQRGVTVARQGHPIVEADPKMWQPLRVHYDLPAGGGRGRRQAQVEQATQAPGERRDVKPPDSDEQDGPQRPPTSGPGSGVDTWRRYAAAVTGSPVESYGALSRDEVIALLESEGVG